MDIPDLESVDIALSTTRSVRRRIDWDRPVPREVIERCIDIATQAPTGMNHEAWRFLVLTEPERKLRMADLYRSAFEQLSERTSQPSEVMRTVSSMRTPPSPGMPRKGSTVIVMLSCNGFGS